MSFAENWLTFYFSPHTAHSQWLGAQSLSTEREWTGLGGVKVCNSELWVSLVQFGPPLSGVATVYSRWHVVWKRFEEALVMAAPLLWDSETGEDERLSEARVRLRNICREGRSRPRCSAAGRAEVAGWHQVSEKTRTGTLGFQLLPAVCGRSACRRAWHWWSLPGRRRGLPG